MQDSTELDGHLRWQRRRLKEVAVALGGEQVGPATQSSPLPRDLDAWVSLFYDLIYVAAILVFSTAVDHVHPEYEAFWILAVFAGTWWIWFLSTVGSNRFELRGAAHRILLLFQMFVIVLMAMEARVSVSTDSSYLSFEYALLLGTVALMYLRGERRGGPARAYAAGVATANALAAAVFLVGSFLGETPRLLLALGGLLISILPSSVLVLRSRSFDAGDEEHFIERMAAFTLIVCGEAFLENAITVSHATLNQLDISSMAFEFILIFALFSTYFSDVPAAGLDKRRSGWWSGLHLIAQICLAATAIGASKVVDLKLDHHVTDEGIVKLTVPLVLFYLALAGIGMSGRRRPIGPLLIARLSTAAALILVGVVAWSIPWVHLVEALPLLVAVVVAHGIVASKLLRGSAVISAAQIASVSAEGSQH